MVAPGIRFNDDFFSEPTQLRGWTPPKFAGVFAILVRDPNWAPKPFQVLFFGEFGNNVREIHLPNEHLGLARVLGAEALWIAVFPMPFSTTAQRSAVRNRLMGAYNPIWQTSPHAAPSELARKLEDLEKKHEEQTTQVQLLLATVNRYFEPQPEPTTRRRIGFLPPSLTAA